MSDYKPSVFQQAIFDFVETGEGSAIVEAVAGSGKTTTIVHALDFIPQDLNVRFLAFNKSIAMELSTRVPPFVTCQTLNSAGMQAFRNMVSGGTGKAFIKLDANKNKKIVQSLRCGNIPEVTKLVSLAKAYGIVPEGYRGATGLLEDSDDTWIEMIDRFDLDVPSWKYIAVIDAARDALRLSLRDTRLIDFDDQMYMPVVFDAEFDRCDWLFVDEAQDVSPIQRAMLRKMLKPEGRLIAVGDPCQAIYGFRGADSASLRNIAKEFDAIRLPLSISYRCPRQVVQYAKKVVSHIEPSPTAPEGSVQVWEHYDGSEFRSDDDMVVCRNTAPLVRLAYALITRRIPAKVLGREIGTSLVTLVRKMNTQTIVGDKGLIKKLSDWQEKQMQRLIEQEKEDLMQAVEDKVESIMAFIESAGCDDVECLIRSIDSLFGADAGNAITLCTVHKAKGLEAERLFVLNDWLMPSKYARQPWQQEQEENLRYVAYTRAQSDLIFIDSEMMVDSVKALTEGRQIDDDVDSVLIQVNSEWCGDVVGVALTRNDPENDLLSDAMPLVYTLSCQVRPHGREEYQQVLFNIEMEADEVSDELTPERAVVRYLLPRLEANRIASWWATGQESAA